MIASRINLANSASGYCMNSVFECVCVAGWVGAVLPGVKCPHPTNQRYVILETKWTLLTFLGQLYPGVRCPLCTMLQWILVPFIEIMRILS